ncbi:MAG: UPF0182 family protein [Acidimicrobiales bacterium]
MRSPAEIPRRAPRTSRRFRIGVLVAIVVVIVILSSARGVARFYTSYLWFREVHFTSVFRGVLVTRIVLAVVFTLLFFALLLASLTIADRWAPRVLPAEQRDELVDRYRSVVAPRGGIVRVVTALIFALFAGIGANSQWNNWVLFNNGGSFGIKDPLFHRDLGFYVFKLPFIEFLLGWSFGAVVVLLLVTAVAHYLSGGIRFQGPRPRVTPAVKAHLSVLLGALAVIQAFGYYFARLQLVLSRAHFIDGATATSVHANLPADDLLIAIAVVAAVLFLYNIRVRGWILPVVAVGVWAVVWIVVGNIYPAIYQAVRVNPSELTQETRYIARNITFTRAAYGLNNVRVVSNQFDSTSSQVVPVSAIQGDGALARADRETLANVQLQDPGYLLPTYDNQQSLRAFYSMNNLSVDRYVLNLNGKETLSETLLGVRELNSQVPSGFTTSRLQYTHGYGAVVAPATQVGVSADGYPNFTLQNVPPTGQPALSETGSQVYFGEGSQANGYVIADTKQQEIDYEDAAGNETTNHYAGSGGVPVDGFFRRVAFALSFNSLDILLSGQITHHSRIMYNRNLIARVEKAAPFLQYDANPYASIVGGQLYWIVDAYTTTDNYPYSQQADTSRVAGSSGLAGTFNYVRNSVKVVVNAYTGRMYFFVVDPTDPVVRAYERAFPDLFLPGSAADTLIPGITAHFRYPEDLFKVQTNMYGRYHLTSPSAFFSQANAWNISQDPGSGRPGTPTQQTLESATGRITYQVTQLAPEYEGAAMPGQHTQHFMLVQPFVPYSPTSSRQNLTGVMFVSSDQNQSGYGQLTVYETPPDEQVNGPKLVNTEINNNLSISQELTLLNQQGSEVILGHVVLVPIDNTLLYVQPVYVQSSNNQVPQLKDVIVVYDNTAYHSYNASLDNALCQITNPDGSQPFAQYCSTPAAQRQSSLPNGVIGTNGGSTTTTTTTLPSSSSSVPTTPGVTAPSGQSVSALLADAERAFSAANTALSAGNLGQYQTDVRQAEADVAAARAESARSPGGTTSSTTTTTTPTTTTTKGSGG